MLRRRTLYSFPIVNKLYWKTFQHFLKHLTCRLCVTSIIKNVQYRWLEIRIKLHPLETMINIIIFYFIKVHIILYYDNI